MQAKEHNAGRELTQAENPYPGGVFGFMVGEVVFVDKAEYCRLWGDRRCNPQNGVLID